MKMGMARTWFFIVIVIMTAPVALIGDNVPGHAYAKDDTDQSGTPPGKATLVSPTGTIYVRNPIFVWNAVPDTIQYWLEVTDSGGSLRGISIITSQEAGCAAGTGTCSMNRGSVFGLGNLIWRIQAINDAGSGPWSDSLSFFIPSSPYPVGLSAPSGVINFANPTYRWNASFSATRYRLRVVDGSGAEKINALYTPAELGCAVVSDCSVTPWARLAAGDATAWVQPYNETDGYGVWSYPLAFKFDPEFHFNEQFSGPWVDGWEGPNCSWVVEDGAYRPSILGEIAHLFYYNAFLKNADYQARLRRAGCQDCSNYLILRSSGSMMPGGDPQNGYFFGYTANGYFSVWLRVNWVDYPLQSWTGADAINTDDQWNALRVVALGSRFQFYINGTLVWSGADSTLGSGRVGLGSHSIQTGGDFRVDWAILSTPTMPVAGDVDGDGNADIIWRNTASGGINVWLMNGAAVTGDVWPPCVTDQQWQIVGIGDFKGDGNADVLWRYIPTGDMNLWFMNGTAVTSDAWLPRVSDPQWQIAGVGDFNKDGKSDIVWRNTTSGDINVWLMNGGTVTSDAWLPLVSDRNWQIAGIGDFNGDGGGDIVWRYLPSGDLDVWLMDGITVTSDAWLPRVADPQWQINAIGDFNGDGNAEIVWRHTVSGDINIWFLNGSSFVIDGWLPRVADQQWKIFGPR
jgi:hypothetical protein